MVLKMESIGLMLAVSVVLAIQPSTCGLLDNEKLVRIKKIAVCSIQTIIAFN